MASDIAARLERVAPTGVEGRFWRHSSRNWPVLAGSPGGGRYGSPGVWVLYQARPEVCVAGEAWRAFVDRQGVPAHAVRPRRLTTVRVDVTQILDLREDWVREDLGLAEATLWGPHEPCQELGDAVSTAGWHGIVAPAACALGEVLALYVQNLPTSERPRVTNRRWWHDGLPPEPPGRRRAEPE